MSADNHVAANPDAVDAVVSILTLHGSDLVIAAAAVIALRHILRGIDKDLAVVRGGAVGALTHAVAIHGDTPSIISSFVAALNSLSIVGENCRVATRCGALPVLVRVLKESLSTALEDGCIPAFSVLPTCLDTICNIVIEVRTDHSCTQASCSIHILRHSRCSSAKGMTISIWCPFLTWYHLWGCVACLCVQILLKLDAESSVL